MRGIIQKSRGISYFSFMAIGMLSLVLTPVAPAVALPQPTDVPSYHSTINPYDPEAANGKFAEPKAMAFDSSGNIYVVDNDNNRIQKFDSNGNYLLKWGSYGSSNGQFENPRSIGIDSSNNVYVGDLSRDDIQKFDSSGNFISKFGSYGSGDGQFDNSYGIDFDSAGNIFVVESNNNRIQKFDSNGTYVSQFGTYGDDDGELDEPRGLAIDNSDNVWVTDYNNYRVQKFASDGTYISQFGSSGTGDGQFSEMYGIDVDSSGNVYVADRGNCRIQKFNSSGAFVTKWGASGGDGTCGENNGEFDSPSDVRVDGAGNIYVVDEDNDRIQKFDSNGTYISQFGGYGTIEISGSNADGKFNAPRDMAQDSQGNIYVADGSNNRIQKFDKNGNFIAKWGANGGDGSNGTGNGEFDFPESIVIDSSDNIYVGEANNYRVQKLDKNGNFIAKWGANGGDGSPGPGDGEYGNIRGLAIAPDGNLLVVDDGNYRIQKINSTTGAFISKFGSYGSADGQFNAPAGIATDSNGNIYVADMYNYRVQKFDSTGSFVAKWGQSGTGNGEFGSVSAIDVDSLGNVYALDYDNSRVQKFDTDGNYLTQWGSYGTGDSQFDSPEGLKVSSNGNTIFVVDSDNQRIQIFKYGSDEVAPGPVEPEPVTPEPVTPGPAESDLNGDGVDDATQSNVSGKTSPITGKSVVLALDSSCDLTTDSIVREPQLATQDAAYSYDNGLWNFEANCGTSGYTTTVKLYYYNISYPGQILRKHNPSTNAFFTINDANITTQTINGSPVVVATYQVTDGGTRDIDGVANGIIKDPVGLAQANIGAPNTGL